MNTKCKTGLMLAMSSVIWSVLVTEGADGQFAPYTPYAETSSQAGKPMFERDAVRTIGRDEATKEWLKSWHKGEVYMTQAEYLYDARLETEKMRRQRGGGLQSG